MTAEVGFVEYFGIIVRVVLLHKSDTLRDGYVRIARVVAYDRRSVFDGVGSYLALNIEYRKGNTSRNDKLTRAALMIAEHTAEPRRAGSNRSLQRARIVTSFNSERVYRIVVFPRSNHTAAFARAARVDIRTNVAVVD